MRIKTLFVLSGSLLFASCASEMKAESTWPQAGGAKGNWQVQGVADSVSHFSVSSNKNIKWASDLPEGGQSGIAVFGDRLFLTIRKPVEKTDKKLKLSGANIVGLCVDEATGKILWQREIKGTVESKYMYGFSDSSTPTPITDGEHVWFMNASGTLACYDFTGNEVWNKVWKPVTELGKVHFPFNKQFEPIMSGDIIVNQEPYWGEDGKRTYGWNYLVGYDKKTGVQKWISEDALTHYNTPYLSQTPAGKDAILIGRGGHHRVPEGPAGYSMIDAQTGKTIWAYKAKTNTALYNSSWNDKYAVWITETGELVVLDANSGKELRKIQVNQVVDLRRYDETKKVMVSELGINLKEKYKLNVFPAWFSNILIGDKLFFLCFEEGRYRKKIGPKHSLCRVDLKTGKVEYLQLPSSPKTAQGVYKYNESIPAGTVNSRGLDVAGEGRSKRDGWHWNFNGNPIAVNGKIYYTMMNGVGYCLDANALALDTKALLGVNDLGTVGETWSLNTPSYANGKLYHRSLKQLICIEKQ